MESTGKTLLACLVVMACGGQEPAPDQRAAAAGPAAEAPGAAPSRWLEGADYCFAGLCFSPDSVSDSARVIALHGPPDSVVVVPMGGDSMGPAEVHRFYYPSLTVTVADRKVAAVVTTSARYLSARGLRIGDARSRAESLYPGFERRGDSLLVGFGDLDPWWLMLIRDDRVLQLRLGQEYW